MKSIKTLQTNLALRISLLAGLTIILFLGYFALTQHIVHAAVLPLLDDKVLEEKAVAAAQMAGLQETPIAKRAVHLTLAEWLKLNDAELGKDAAQFGLSPDMPVFVLAMRGNVTSLLAGGALRPEQKAPEKFNNITVVLDARTGEVMWTATIRDGFTMPVSVP
jgi:hypothetical protein